MSMNRLFNYLSEQSPRFSFEVPNEPRRVDPQQAFVACPVVLLPVGIGGQMTLQNSLYRLAYEQAVATVAARQQVRDSAFPWN
jgi:hypothetical protein